MALPLFSAALGLSQFAPAIARWLGGQDGDQVASQVIEIAKRIAGCDDPLAAINSLAQSPELVIEFQKAITAFEAEMELAFLRDRQDARARDLAYISSGRSNSRADIMVLCAAGGLISCLVALAYYSENLPGEAVGIISTIAGIFGACLKDAYTFEFGSSRSSTLKDTAMAVMMERGGLS